MANDYGEPFVLDFPDGQRVEDILKKAESDYSKAEIDAALSGKVDKETGKGLSTNDYTDAEKTKLAGIEEQANRTTVDDVLSDASTNPVQNKVVKAALDNKADATDIPTVPITDIQKNGTSITPVGGTVNITVPTTAADISALPDTTRYAAALSLTINSSTFVLTGQLKDQNGDNLGTAQTIDLPLESVVVGGSYDSQTQKVVLTLQNGNTVEFSVADLVSGLQTELSESNKLNPAYIDYDSTHRAVSDAEKSAWNNKVDKETGKGLSTNDYTDAEKTKLAGIEAQANKTVVDDTLSDSSTNPVQNKIIQAPIARLVDSGAKNLIQNTATSRTESGVTFTVNADGTVSLTGTASATIWFPIMTNMSIDAGTYTISNGLADDTARVIISTTNSLSSRIFDSNESGYITKTVDNISGVTAYLRVASGRVTDGAVVKPMLCPKAAWDISHEYKPYAMNNLELTQSVKPIPRLVDAEAKNLLKITGTSQTIRNVTFTVNGDGTVSVNGTNNTSSTAVFYLDILSADIAPNYNGCILTGCPQGGSASTYRLAIQLNSGSFTSYASDVGNGATIHDVPASDCRVVIAVYPSATVNNLIFKPMICTAEDYAISPTFVPYAKSNYELTRDVKPIPGLVDAGTKNIFKMREPSTISTHGITFVINTGGTVDVSTDDNGATVQTDLTIGEITTKNGINYVWSGCPSGGSSTTYRLMISSSVYDEGNGYAYTSLADGTRRPFIRIYSGAVITSPVRFYPMLCTAEDYAISPEFVPYAMSNQELTKETETNRNRISKDEAAIAELIDSSAKNYLLNGETSRTINGVTFTIMTDKTVELSGTATSNITNFRLVTMQPAPEGNMVLSGCPSGGAYNRYKLDILNGGTSGDVLVADYGNGVLIDWSLCTTGYYTARIRIESGQNVDGLIFKPMLCTKAAWDISQAYVPYRPSYDELIARVEALEQAAGINSARSMANLTTETVADATETEGGEAR